MFSLQTLIGLAIGAWMAFLGVHAQCLQNAGYLGAYDATTGAFVGAISKNLNAGGFTLDTSGVTSNYLAVAVFSTVCNNGGPLWIEILSPDDPVAGYVSLVCGSTLCNECAFIGSNDPFVAIVAGDGNPLGPFPTPGFTQNTFGGGYGDLHTDCGENQVWVLGSAVTFGRQVLVPSWRDPSGTLNLNLIVLLDETNNGLVVAANATVYSVQRSATVRQLQLTVFI
ncbi:hypothetical protein MSAN_02480600 [Mycena sanguinolenta]|uniref:Uncharacterized protein n=1 Tax=Mycena sanguinolenta TaxID=230812 RepID=A0A8H6U492_9AGAR|nr:hypothetical protein MSAN_02480600 [Mycena sanguinolenta]